MTIALSAAQAQSTCTADSNCTGVDEACVFGRCLQVRCNADSECTNRLPLCINGSCQSPSCSADSDCARGGCVGGHCEKVECTTNAACPSGRSCVDHHCRDCVTDAQCGSTGVCRSNSCVCVECKGAQQCAVDQKCNSESSCVPFCEEGRIFVSGSDGNRICKTCVNPNTAKRCNEFPGCGRNTFCAQGFCINRCSLDPPDFDGLLDDFRDLRYLPDPDGLPDCPHCYAIFDLAGLRTVLERGGVDQPVSLRLLQSSGKPFADFGTVKPHKGSWASVPLQAQPKLEGELSKDERCGYTLEIRGQSPDGKTATAPICLIPGPIRPAP
jgi:hypothetical protein